MTGITGTNGQSAIAKAAAQPIELACADDASRRR